MISPREIVFIVGPTSVGKTEISFELSQKLKSEIISCDAMQVYKEISILNNKPSPNVIKTIPHYLIGIISISQEFNVMDFNKKALTAIKEIHAKNKVPIVCGGSGLYMAILLDGIFEGAPQDPELRQELERLAEMEGPELLHEKLLKLDPQSASKIHKNDKTRLIRALEVMTITGQPISKMKSNRSGIYGQYNVKIFGLQRLRQNLYQRINDRVDDMFEEGAVLEVEGLKNSPWSLTAKKIIGVKEIMAYLNNECTVDRAKYLIKMNTRHYAKRQLTWFRREKRIQWLDLEAEEQKSVVQKILNNIKG